MPRDGQKPEMSKELSDGITNLTLEFSSENVGSINQIDDGTNQT